VCSTVQCLPGPGAQCELDILADGGFAQLREACGSPAPHCTMLYSMGWTLPTRCTVQNLRCATQMRAVEYFH